VNTAAFSPEWLARRLAALLADFPDVGLCVALSGGMDSVTLLAALAARQRARSRKATDARFRTEAASRADARSRTDRRGRTDGRSRTHFRDAPRVRAVHVHHGLHPNADKWTEHCATIAAQLHVPLTVLRVKVARPRGASLEAAARDARYEALATELWPGEVLLTAHHEDDQLETVFLQLMRGAGIAGMAAMPEVTHFAQGVLARPLLTRSRADLEAWATSQALTWIDDDTNADEQLDRNYLRRRVLPVIRARWPSVAASVARTARHAAEAKRLLDTLALADVERASNGPALSVQHLRILDPDRRRNALRFWIARSGFTLPDTRRLDEITGPLLEARPDANPQVQWNGTLVQRHADLLSVQSKSATPVATATQVEDTDWNWRARSRVELGAARGALSIEPDPHGPIDLDSLPDTLTIRTRRGGERLRPSRGRPTKTLKSLFQEARLPLADREHIPLIFRGDYLVAAADRWLDASVQATQETRHRARLRWHRLSTPSNHRAKRGGAGE
jgi:tRNA(Ile)-lysidine synthase